LYVDLSFLRELCKTPELLSFQLAISRRKRNI
jgi:hypothetical protein